MLVEKFDFLEFLRLAIANGAGNGKKISKDIVLGEIALLKPHARMWASLLVEKVDFERIAIITPAEPQFIYKQSRYKPEYTIERRIADKPGKVEFKQGEISSGDFFRVRNILAAQIHKEMIKNNFKPNNCQGDLSNIAKGIAEVVLRGHLFVKAMCGTCQGIGKLEIYNSEGCSSGSKFCIKCEGTGKRPYTLNEKINIAKLSITKMAYSKSYSKYELLGESIVAEWEITIRDRLARSFYYEPEISEHA